MPIMGKNDYIRGSVLMKIFNTLKKYGFISFIFCVCLYHLEAEVFFSGTAGTSLDILPAAHIENAEVRFKGFYRAQMQIGQRFFSNGAISLRSGNVFQSPQLRDIPSLFNIDELSLMYRFKIEKSTAQLSLFFSEYEPLGADTFAGRYVGAKKFTSYLLKKQIGIPAPSIIPVSGIGGAFTVTYSAPVAQALYFYYDKKYGSEQLNTDMRVAGVSNAFVGDFLFGASFPLESTDADGNAVVLIIRRAEFHLGFTALIGDNPYANLYVQAGLARIQAKPDSGNSVLSLADLYAFIEPRFALYKTVFSLSMFTLPEQTYKKTAHIDEATGAAFMIRSTACNLGSTQGIFGGIACACVPNPAVTDFNPDNIVFKLVPFAEFTVKTGALSLCIPVRPLEYNNVSRFISLSASYTVQL